MVPRLALIAALVAGAWVGALAGLVLYLNEFSETERAGGWAVLGVSWFAVVFALCATFWLLVACAFALVDWRRSHA